MKPPSLISIGIFLLSGSALAYEVILIRMLSMTRFHHLAFMVLSLALLGYGASGVLLAYGRRRFLKDFRSWFAVFATVFALGSVVCFQVSQRIPLHPGQWLWTPFEAGFLVVLYFVLSLPFFAAACGVGLAYCAMQYNTGLIYRADLLGAATGSLGALLVLWLPEAQGLWLPWCGGLWASAIILLPNKKRMALGLFILALSGPATNYHRAVKLLSSDEKPLSTALSADGAKKMADIFTPMGRITVIRNTVAPYRYAPGLSLTYDQSVPPQWVAFTDGEAKESLLITSPAIETFSFLDYLPDALPYKLAYRENVLILEAYSNEHTIRAGGEGASTITVAMSNPGWQSLHHDPEVAPVFVPPLFTPVQLTIGAAREYLKTRSQDHSLIVMRPPNRSSMQPDYLHTVEAYQLALSKLSFSGVLAISAPSDLPPRAGLRLLTTAKIALKRAGAAKPADHMALIRSLRTVHLIVKKNKLTANEISAIRAFCMKQRFDPVWFPEMGEKEANLWNQTATPLFHQAAKQILSPQSDLFLKSYKFDIGPTYDNRPYVAHFFKLKTFVELFSLRAGGGLGVLSVAEPVLAATLVQAFLLALLSVWLPLRRYRPSPKRGIRGSLYLMLGIGFMLVEYAVLEKMTLFLNAPVLAVAVTLAGFLAMAGFGGGMTTRWIQSEGKLLQKAGLAALIVAGVVTLYMLMLPLILQSFLSLPLSVRIPLALLLITPVALAMGTPFPLAIAVLKKEGVKAIPWAWGLNGCGSLIGPVLGVTLSIYGGINIVLMTGICCYMAVFFLGLFPHSRMTAANP
jgi:hypothetical protein